MHPRVIRRLAVAMLPALLVAGCGSGPGPSATISPLSDALNGVCQARAALPDADAADRAFTNVAHEALHTLAADPGLERDLAGQVLEAMEQVEADFESSAGADALDADLGDLEAAAGAALGAVGVEVPPCGS
jgi:hypothetical protein